MPAEELAATIGEYGVLAWSEGENTGTSGKGLEASHRSKGTTLTCHELNISSFAPRKSCTTCGMTNRS
ncbi:MAG: hypothetical protein PHE55_19180 [Methylococcaceae bacterium]|jgi:hypothetical protein|nr:hypothetical protein [Methylococcaceae bacterium]